MYNNSIFLTKITSQPAARMCLEGVASSSAKACGGEASRVLRAAGQRQRPRAEGQMVEAVHGAWPRRDVYTSRT